jgi:hypothetical protein
VRQRSSSVQKLVQSTARPGGLKPAQSPASHAASPSQSRQRRRGSVAQALGLGDDDGSAFAPPSSSKAAASISAADDERPMSNDPKNSQALVSAENPDARTTFRPTVRSNTRVIKYQAAESVRDSLDSLVQRQERQHK